MDRDEYGVAINLSIDVKWRIMCMVHSFTLNFSFISMGDTHALMHTYETQH